ncbi:hypothetical protein [Tumebacillus permanentifrigoris]|uniref:Uncharacterized protein n=1 Tax=Tumebacillus permanentifrigoris TaxID=378543 RepID=A0A316D2Z4_9BACL|nr:hypothetical protein [Tumebacillus permanentifrigoris]PWK05317.1 hypothetical protein C7459_12466 [Tumebacillus permanentifrigoris]
MSLDFEDKILRRFELAERRKAMKEEMDLLDEEIEAHFNLSSIDGDMVIPLPNGEFAVVSKKAYIKDVFDKDSLANEMLIAKDELKTPFDFSILTSQGKLTPDMISKHTTPESIIKISLRKRKTKPKKKG